MGNTRRNRVAAQAAAILAVIVLLLGGTVQRADAQSNHRWYGLINRAACCYSGMAVYLHVLPGAYAVDNPQAPNFGHVLNTTWLNTGGGTGTTYWVEAGWNVGGLVSFSSTVPVWYWGDFRPSPPGQGNLYWNGTWGWYFDHAIGTATPMNSYHQTAILQDSTPGRYGIIIDGTIWGWSTGNIFGGNRQQAGVESYIKNDDAWVNYMPIVSNWGLQYRDNNLNWHSGWNNSGPAADPPAGCSWSTPQLSFYASYN